MTGGRCRGRGVGEEVSVRNDESCEKVGVRVE